ncbi:MAG: L,D-transpeptidase family protein [Rubrimonas sp.]
MDRRSFALGLAALATTGGRVAALDGFERRGRPDDRIVIVDISRAMLYALNGAEITLASRVIVGAPKTPTPVVDSEFDHIQFRPSWRPTPSMIRSGLYEDGVRPPGRNNPLGLAAVKFRDGGLIYLHGTNRPELFQRERRALSNGCVRVQALTELIAWLLAVPMDEVEGHMNGRRTFNMDTLPIPLIMRHGEGDDLLTVLARVAGVIPA